MMRDHDTEPEQDAGAQIDNLLFKAESVQTDADADTPIITDEDARQALPRYALALEYYHLRRLEGKPPEEALQETIHEWRQLWRGSAFVPHRNNT